MIFHTSTLMKISYHPSKHIWKHVCQSKYKTKTPLNTWTYIYSRQTKKISIDQTHHIKQNYNHWSLVLSKLGWAFKNCRYLIEQIRIIKPSQQAATSNQRGTSNSRRKHGGTYRSYIGECLHMQQVTHFVSGFTVTCLAQLAVASNKVSSVGFKRKAIFKLIPDKPQRISSNVRWVWTCQIPWLYENSNDSKQCVLSMNLANSLIMWLLIFLTCASIQTIHETQK